MTNVLLIVAIIVGVGLISTIAAIGLRFRQFSELLFDNPDVVSALETQKEIYDATPKDVSSMTKIELPRIEKDFPEFSWPQWKKRCENQLLAYLEARSKQSISGNGVKAAGFGAALKEQLRLEIESDIQAGKVERFENVNIHATEICRYEKKSGICRIRIESSIQYNHSLKEKEKTVLTNKLEQAVYELELLYVQDADLAGKYSAVVGFNCPNCGAPIKVLGVRTCPYCGTGIEPINIRVWELQRIQPEQQAMKR